MEKLLNELKKKELEYKTSKNKLALREARLITQTDFKELGCTNQKMRDAYVTDKLATELVDKVAGKIYPSTQEVTELEVEYHALLREYEVEKNNIIELKNLEN